MVVDGIEIKNEILSGLTERVADMNLKPRLSVFTVGDDFAMKSFVGIKRKAAEKVGVEFNQIELGEDISQEELLNLVKEESGQTDGIVIQLPLPDHMDKAKIINSIDINLDVDVLSEKSYKNFLNQDIPKVVPPVAGSVMNILNSIEESEGFLVDKKVVIVGNGFLTGKPVFDLLIKNDYEDVSIIDEDTDKDLFYKECLEADILISGTGVPNLIKKEMIKEGVILIDMGSSSDKGVLTGDIDTDCSEKASYFSKTPGGVGPGTVAVLFQNLINSLN